MAIASGSPWKLPPDSTSIGAGRLVDKDQRVVGDGVEFDLHDPARVGDGVAHRAVHLRDAAQRVGVLHVGGIVRGG